MFQHLTTAIAQGPTRREKQSAPLLSWLAAQPRKVQVQDYSGGGAIDVMPTKEPGVGGHRVEVAQQPDGRRLATNDYAPVVYVSARVCCNSSSDKASDCAGS